LQKSYFLKIFKKAKNANSANIFAGTQNRSELSKLESARTEWQFAPSERLSARTEWQFEPSELYSAATDNSL